VCGARARSSKWVALMVDTSASPSWFAGRCLPARSGWDWVTIEGDVDLVGPDDRLDGVRAESVAAVFHEIYSAAIGGTPDDWAERDDAIARERHAAVIVRPTRVYSNPRQV
jgi:hypothetical protein